MINGRVRLGPADPAIRARSRGRSAIPLHNSGSQMRQKALMVSFVSGWRQRDAAATRFIPSVKNHDP